MTGRTAAYGRAAFAWAVKRGAVRVNPFADLPVAKGIAKRERVLSDDRDCGDLARRRRRRGALRQIVRLLILTGQRRGEVAGMAWESFGGLGDLDHAGRAHQKRRRSHGAPECTGARSSRGVAARRCE